MGDERGEPDRAPHHMAIMTSRARARNDRGLLVASAVLVLILIGMAALLTARAVGYMVTAAVHEALAAQERATARASTEVIDAWMTDPEVATAIFVNPPPDYFNAVGDGCTPGTDTACWRIDTITDVGGTAVLRGGVASRGLRDVAVAVVTGCEGSTVDDCRRVGGFVRRYEQTVFSQYQLHFDSHDFPPPVPPPGVDAARLGPDLMPSSGDEPNIGLSTVIVFGTGDALNGPLRTGLSKVLHCGSPTFDRMEVAADEPSPLAAPLESVPGCTGTPGWSHPNPTPANLIGAGRLVYAGSSSTSLRLPGTDHTGALVETPAPSRLDHECVTINYDHLLPTDPCGFGRVADGDVIGPPPGDSDVTVQQLDVDGSVTVYAPGDIIIEGEIKATGSNSAGGPNVVALIAGGNVRIETVTPPATCLDPSHSVELDQVALLAPQGAVIVPGWEIPPCTPGNPPEVELNGSIAAKYLGLYGVPDHATGGVVAGWVKNFSYPTNFWLGRPAWWPGHSNDEWIPSGGLSVSVVEPAGTAPAPEPVLTVAAAAAAEGDPAGVVFTVALSQDATSVVTVNYATSNDSATAGDDYTATASTLTIAVGARSGTISVPLLDDTVVEAASETFTLTLTNPTNARFVDSTTTGPPPSATVTAGTILDDDLHR